MRVQIVSEREDKIIKEAKERFRIATDAWSTFLQEAKTTLNFINGDQWDAQLRNNRVSGGLPVLTVNVLKPFLRQITNEARQNIPSIQIDPKDDSASADNAETIADLIRAIEQQSNAPTAYDQASWYAAASGIGYIRVITDYESPDTFEQKLIIKHVEDPATVLMDPAHKALDGSDAEWCFVTTCMSKDDYIRQFGGSKKAQALMKKVGLAGKGWSTPPGYSVRSKEEIIIAEYYWKEYTDVTLYKILDLTSGQTFVSKEKPAAELLETGLVHIIETRPSQECKVKWAKINDEEILEETEWPGTKIPVVCVKGDEIWIAGKRHIKGACTDAIDSQRALNYFQSEAAQLVALAPKTPFVGEIRQFKNFEQLWRDANNSAAAYLPYNAVEVGGQVLGPPERQTFEAPIQAASAMIEQAKDNLKSIFGIFDASLGAQGNEISGKAILARQTQSHTTTYHFYDNLVKAIEAVGRILVEVIPVYYGDERQVQLLKRNGESSTAKVNGDNGKHDLTVGNFGVVVETGPSYSTKRQEAVEAMCTLGEVYPQAMPLIADLIAGESDWPESKKVAARLAMMLPPQIQQMESNKGDLNPKQQLAALQQQSMQTQQQLQQAQQLIQVGHQHIQELEEEIKLLKTKAQIEYEKMNSDNAIKTQQMHLSKYQSDLEYQVKLKELAIQEQELEISKAKLAVDTIDTMHGMSEDHMDRATEHHDRMTALTPVSDTMNGKTLD